MKKDSFEVDMRAMREEELIEVIKHSKTIKADLYKAISLYIGRRPVNFLSTLLSIAEDEEVQDKTRSRVMYYLASNGYIDHDIFDPD